MAITELSLPVDIPWKRMAVSRDMIAPRYGELDFPQKWLSSIAVFYHEPAELPPDYCDRKVTYLKVACTMSSYQWDPEDDNRLRELADRYKEHEFASFEQSFAPAYPCYGALVQVAVYPNPAEGVELQDLPYISSFQPRKREMYEVVSESGEVASQSSNKINVLKGTTVTDTNENYDLDLGGGGGSAAFGLASWQLGQKQQGVIDRLQNQNQNVRTADTSREKRESHSSSTSVNQLYSLLQGFHIGTNRCLFFLQPTPHIQDGKFTFVHGPRRLEGIQEFFLIVDRPASTPGLCVEAVLETAHLYTYRAYQPRIIHYADLFLPGNLGKTAAALGIPQGALTSYSEPTLVATWNGHDPWKRFLAKEYRDQRISWDAIDSWVHHGQFTWVDFCNLVKVTELLPDVELDDVALIFEAYEADQGEIFIVARRLAACVRPPEPGVETGVHPERSEPPNLSTVDTRPPSIVLTRPYGGSGIGGTKSAPGTARGRDLNLVTQDVNDVLRSSLAALDRRPYGAVSLLETDFMLNDLAHLVGMLKRDGIEDPPLGETRLAGWVERGLGSASGVRTVTDLASLSTRQLARDLNVPDDEAARNRRALLLDALAVLDPRTIPADAVPTNPIFDRLQRDFPEARLRLLDESAHLVGAPQPQAKGGRRFGFPPGRRG